ncbi:MAG: 1-acyl-sn-glycerol-3-phosphate acyltransferase [Flavobacteriales bacterium]|nr:1-acyl-sn-glycerol-3-phosphate acyltransferase [Flavobacteriales bacterium]
MDLKVYGEEHVNFENGQRYVIMSNHTSLMDIPVVLHALGSTIRFMSKDSILKIPIIGSAMRASGFVSIDRKSGFQAKKDLAYAKKKLEEGIQLWVSPEGTRSADGELLPFKRGVFKMAMEVDALIIPVGLIGCNKVVLPDTMEPYLNERVEVHIGDPIDTSLYSKDTIVDLMQVTREKIMALKAS